MRPTARQVAELANVSVATVSYVLSGKDRPVAAETRQRVLDAARQLGYTPNQAARSLRSRRTKRICLVLSTFGGVPTDERLATDLHEMADARGYSVVSLSVYSEARASAAVEVLRGGIADGALINLVGDHLTHDLLGGLAATRLPMVVLSNENGLEGCDVVRTPEMEACVEAIEHLLAAGRRRVAYMAHRHELYRDKPAGRLLGYLTTLDRHGIKERVVTGGADDRVSAHQTATELLTSSDRPDAIFAASDRAAITAIWAARDLGLSVPGDVAIVGAGNIDEGLISNPQLSTIGPIRHDYTDVVRLLFDRLQAEEPPPAREIVRPWTFIRRGSA